jgi:hypothetical protein
VVEVAPLGAALILVGALKRPLGHSILVVGLQFSHQQTARRLSQGLQIGKSISS